MKNTVAQLESYRHSLLKYVFEGKLTEKWRKDHRNQSDSSKILEQIGRKRNRTGREDEKYFVINTETLPPIPSEWIWTTLRVITESMKNGIYKLPRFYNNDGIACLRMYNIHNGSIVWKDIKRMVLTAEEISEYKLLPGDILVNRVNSRELVGKASTIPQGLETCVYESKNIRLRVLNDFVVSKFVSFWLQFYAQTYFSRNVQQTVGMASINQNQLGSMPIPLMSFKEQALIADGVEKRFSIIIKITKEVNESLQYTDMLRQNILKYAMKGKLVTQDPNEEPAEISLRRLKQDKSKNKKRDQILGTNVKQMKLI